MKLFSSWRARYKEYQRQRFLLNYRDVVTNIRLRRAQQATIDSANYVNAHMPLVQSVKTRNQVHFRAIKAVEMKDGLVLEFGVFTGRTARYIVKKSGWHLDGFDSFEGLPEAWRDGFPTGKFKRKAPPDLGPKVTLHVGWFDDTLPKFIADLGDDKRPVRYLHVDCDLYSSTKTIFECLGDRIVAGTVIVFDEYFNYAGWQEGEFKAFQEFVAAEGLTYEYLTYNQENQQVAVKITGRKAG